MQIEGTIIHCLPVKSGTSARGEWKAQDFVIETTDQFSRKMCFSVFGEDRLQRFNIQEGQFVSVSFDIDAREYQGRWFNSIRAYDVRPVAPGGQIPGSEPPYPGAAPFAAAPQQFPPVQPAPQQTAPQQPAQPAGQDDDLPF